MISDMDSPQPTKSEGDTMGMAEKSPQGTEQLIQTNSDNGEVGRKMLKSIQDMTRQLEYVTSKCSSVESLFGSELMSRRNKLRDLCEKYMFEAPENNGTTARDKMWRYVFYEAISKAKRLKQREKWTPLERAFVKQHLLNGIGQLSLLMLKLQQTVDEFKNLKLRVVQNGLDNILPSSLVEKQNHEETTDPEWTIRLLYLLLLNIGDLCRYLTELYEKEDCEMYLNFYDRAQDYYTQAFLLNPNIGLAHNQLGTLSNKHNGGIDATYYFLCSLVSKEPCQGALTNIRRQLDIQLVSFATLSATVACKPVDIFSHNFIKILYQFFSDSTHLTKFAQLCEDTVGSFIILLRGEVGSLDDGFLFRVMSVCIMTVWHLMSSDSPALSSAVCFSIGIFVHSMESLFSILKSHSKLREVIDMPFEAEESCELDDAPEITETELESKSTPSLPPDGKDQDQTSTVELVVQHEPDTFGRRRVLKPRARLSDDFYSYFHHEEDCYENMSESTDNHQGSDTESDFSDSVEDCASSRGEAQEERGTDFSGEEEEEENEDKVSGGHAVDSSEVSDISYQDYQDEIEIERKAAAFKLSQSSDEVISDFNGKKQNMKFKLRHVVELEDLQGCWARLEPIVVAVLPFMRWLQSSLPVQNALAASTEKEVMERLCQTLNMFESTNWSIALRQQWDKDPRCAGEEQNIAEAKQVEAELMRDWKAVTSGKLDGNPFSLELPEDLAMRGWSQFQPITTNLGRKCLTQNQLMVTRIGRLLVFGQWLVGTEDFAVIRSDNIFLVPSVEEYKRHMRRIQMEKFNRRLTMLNKDREFSGRDHKGKKNGKPNPRRRPRLLDRVGGFHVNDEDKVYILFDLPAVLKYLRVIQKLSRHPKFIIMIPYSVSFAVDALKDTDEDGSKVARIANRWFEPNKMGASFKPAIQLLRKEDKLPLENMEYPLVHTPESFEFFDTLECCNYVRSNMKNKKQRPGGRFFKDARDSYRILYLTGFKTLLDSTVDSERDFNPIAACRSTHVFLDRVSRYQKRSRNGKSFQNGHCGG